jgi:predicted nucleic acid-binding protein
VVALLDSVAIAAFIDRSDHFHAAADRRIRELLEERAGLIASVVTYAELLTGAGHGHHAQAAVRGFFDDLLDALHPVDRVVAERAAALRCERRSLRMPDALILATAEVRGADVAITADRRWLGVAVRPRIELLDSPA